MNIPSSLLALQDPEYRKFQQKLIPNIAPESILGVRTPQLRQLAKRTGEREAFLQNLPHHYLEENLLHAFLVEGEKDFSRAVAYVDAFLPYIDNWAVCDQLRPKIFTKHHEELMPHLLRWIASDHPYTIRYGIGMLMVHYLDVDFDPKYPALVAQIRHNDYYVRMMIAWYFATALAKQYDQILPYITGQRLEKWVHNKTIQKSVESYRITPEQKQLLKSYRQK